MWRLRHSLPLVQWLKTHSFIGHSDGHPAQFSTTPLSVCFGRAMPFRPCCGKLCRHPIDAERWDQGARGTAGYNAVRAQPAPRDADALGDVEAMEIAEDPIVVAMPSSHPLRHHKVVSCDDPAREQLLLIEDGHCLRSHSLQACRIVDPVRNEVFQATSLRTLVQMVAAELGITLMPQIAVESELASTRNVVIRPLTPDKPFRTLVLGWRPTTSRGAEFRVLGNLIRECLTAKRAFAPDHDIEALAAR